MLIDTFFSRLPLKPRCISIAIITLLSFSPIVLCAQKDPYFQRTWKNYFEDSANFEFLRLNANGTGQRGMGITINGSDTFPSEAFTKIINWYAIADTLFVVSELLPGRPYFRFTLVKKEPHYFVAIEENDVFRKFTASGSEKKTIKFTDSALLTEHVGLKEIPCLIQLPLFKEHPATSGYRLITKSPIDNLVEHIIACGNGFKYPRQYNDKGYQFVLPEDMRRISYGQGDYNFYFRFDNDLGPVHRTIEVFYDFDGSYQNHFFKEIREGKMKVDTTTVNEKTIWCFKNWQDNFSGKIFLDNNIFIAYYTDQQKWVAQLQKCIASFSFE